jgi:hypothetical protein
MKEVGDEVIFESHQQGEPCEEVKSLGNERIKKKKKSASAHGALCETGKDGGNQSSESFLCSRRTSIIRPKQGKGEKGKRGCSPYRPSFILE